MTLTFPLSRADFWDRLPISSGPLRLTESYAFSATESGEVRTEATGNRLWGADIALGTVTPDEGRDIGPLLDLVRQEGGTFFAWDVRHSGPRDDPSGAILGTATPVIGGLPAGGREMRLNGLPPNYVLRRGDMLSFAYAASPVRYALHKIVDEVVTAGTGGATGLFEVVPRIAAGAVGGELVNLIKPSCKAILRPGTFQPGTEQHFVTRGAAFSIIQTVV